MSDCNLCNRIRAWLNKPFDENGSALDWFLLLALLVVFLILEPHSSADFGKVRQ